MWFYFRPDWQTFRMGEPTRRAGGYTCGSLYSKLSCICWLFFLRVTHGDINRGVRGVGGVWQWRTDARLMDWSVAPMPLSPITANLTRDFVHVARRAIAVRDSALGSFGMSVVSILCQVCVAEVECPGTNPHSHIHDIWLNVSLWSGLTVGVGAQRIMSLIRSEVLILSGRIYL